MRAFVVGVFGSPGGVSVRVVDSDFIGVEGVVVFVEEVGLGSVLDGVFAALGGGAADPVPSEVVAETADAGGVVAELEEDVVGGEAGGSSAGGEVLGYRELGGCILVDHAEH